MQYCASISYGKDSIAMLHVIVDVLHLPLDRIITADVWATETIPADLPPMYEFKKYADVEIKRRWGIEVEHFCAMNGDKKITFDSQFHKVTTRSRNGKRNGIIWGFPMLRSNWCNSQLKTQAIKNAHKMIKEAIEYIGIASDEYERISRHGKKELKRMPLVEAG